ncbi:hypothetical protein TELCIR_00471 [Teladorsagia circumcincta]|uniref:Phosphoglycerate mutase family protein n=1 Tax=Teladorsagia circumcincta TaxID=45464 RepID=A0A2G9V4W9_TELCI|nr:hypothetical protein TELCIR_00471 [Teladorsagia circumcincta]
MDFKAQGKRSLGASKKRCRDVIKKKLSVVTVTAEDALDRTKWRRLNLPMVCSSWPKAVSKKDANHLIAVIRSAERVDRVFGADWPKTEAPHGHFAPTDLNIPSNDLSKKFLEAGFFEDNPPITSFGKYTVQLTARALANRGLRPKLLVCSPSLRSIQTAEALAKFLKAKIAIEPGLVEPLAWYRCTNKNAPDFHLDQVVKLYPVDTD